METLKHGFDGDAERSCASRLSALLASAAVESSSKLGSAATMPGIREEEEDEEEEVRTGDEGTRIGEDYGGGSGGGGEGSSGVITTGGAHADTVAVVAAVKSAFAEYWPCLA